MSTPRRRLTADDVLSARDVALLLHAPVSTVEDWARRGILPSVKIGRRRIYIRESIEAALMDQASPDAHAERAGLGADRLTRAA